MLPVLGLGLNFCVFQFHIFFVGLILSCLILVMAAGSSVPSSHPPRFKGRKKHFSDGMLDKNLPDNTGDMDSIPDLGIFHMPWSS